MIARETILICMNDNEPCLEINEIIYQISGKFWKDAYNELLRKQTECVPGPQVSVEQAIRDFRKEVRKIAKEKGLKYSSFSHKDFFYISLTPYPIYISIEKETGDFSISTPHINTKQFSCSEYKNGLKWIRDYLDIDVRSLRNSVSKAKENFYLSSKVAEIAQTSIKALCETMLGQSSIPYELKQTQLMSNIVIRPEQKDNYEIQVFHKPFSQDTSLLIQFLRNPHEETIENKISCQGRIN